MPAGAIRIALVSALLASVAAFSPSARGAAATGGLRVTSMLKPSSSVYVEGALEYVSIRRTTSRALVLRREFQLGKIKLARRLPAGSYRLASWTRTCSGNCSQLDPPAFACGRTIRVRVGMTLRATVVSQVGKTCRITLGSP